MHKKYRRFFFCVNICCLPLCCLNLVLLFSFTAQAESRNRLLITGGGSSIEGAAGGGIVPMAVISGYGAQEEQGGTVFVSYVDTGDYQLKAAGTSWSWRNRVELSYARQSLEHSSLTDALSLPTDHIDQDIIGVKVRLIGDLIYTDIPQISLGIQHKNNKDFLVPSAVGAKKDSDTDINLSATKLFLVGLFNRNLLTNINLRYTRANQTGLVGFGGDLNNDKELMTELSAGILLNPRWIIGSEYRQKPNNLSFIKEDNWQTIFIGWFPNKNISLVTAYVDLGEVASFKNQTGWYLSLQGSF
jgi:Protein of unknown function (DUF3034)